MAQKTQCPGCGHWYGNIRGSHYSRRPDCRRAYEAQLRRLSAPEAEEEEEAEGVGRLTGAVAEPTHDAQEPGVAASEDDEGDAAMNHEDDEPAARPLFRPLRVI